MEAVATTMLSNTIQKKVITSSCVFGKINSKVNYNFRVSPGCEVRHYHKGGEG
jgi:hypothetical protein